MYNWTAHVHYKDGKTKEITVTTEHPGRKKEATEKVCRAAGILGPNDPLVRGIIMEEDKADGWRAVLGTELKKEIREAQEAVEAAKKPVVVEMKPNSAFRRYKVMVYLSPAQKSPMVRHMSSRSATDALNGVLWSFGIEDSAKCGDYIIYETTRDGTFLRMKKGVWPENVMPLEAEAPAAKVIPLAHDRGNTQPTSYEPIHCCSSIEECNHLGICRASQCAIKMLSPSTARPALAATKPATTERIVKVQQLTIVRRT